MTNWKDVIETDDIKAVQDLINSGANVNEPDENGRTPLMFAAVGQNRKIIKALIKAGADVNTPCKNGETPLMLAATKWHANPQIIKILIRAGADINAKDACGKTSLMYASEGLFVEPKAVKMLVDAGVKASARKKRSEIVKVFKRLINAAAQSRLMVKLKTLLNLFLSSCAEKLRKVPFLAKDNRFEKMCAFYQRRKKICLSVLCLLIVALGFGISHFDSYTATKALNCRDKAGTHGQIIGKIAKGKSVSCSEIKGDWCKTTCGKKEGFVYKKFLSK